jgi:hypothetical protein
MLHFNIVRPQWGRENFGYICSQKSLPDFGVNAEAFQKRDKNSGFPLERGILLQLLQAANTFLEVSDEVGWLDWYGVQKFNP